MTLLCASVCVFGLFDNQLHGSDDDYGMIIGMV